MCRFARVVSVVATMILLPTMVLAERHPADVVMRLRNPKMDNFINRYAEARTAQIEQRNREAAEKIREFFDNFTDTTSLGIQVVHARFTAFRTAAEAHAVMAEDLIDGVLADIIENRVTPPKTRR